MQNEMAIYNITGDVFADSNGRQWRDRNIQTKRDIGFKHTPDKHIRSSSGGRVPGRDKKPELRFNSNNNFERDKRRMV